MSCTLMKSTYSVISLRMLPNSNGTAQGFFYQVIPTSGKATVRSDSRRHGEYCVQPAGAECDELRSPPDYSTRTRTVSLVRVLR